MDMVCATESIDGEGKLMEIQHCRVRVRYRHSLDYWRALQGTSTQAHMTEHSQTELELIS